MMMMMTPTTVVVVVLLIGCSFPHQVICREQDELTSAAQHESVREDGCAACIGVIGLAQNLIQSGNATDEEIMDAVVDACYKLVPVEGWNPDTICDLAIDTYAPHVIYILNVTDKSPAEICTLYNSCSFNDTRASLDRVNDVIKSQQQQQQQQQQSRGHRSPAKPSSKAEEYPGAIKILHFTDMHTDYMYAEGSPAECDMPLCCREEYNGNGSAGYWGDYECNIPHRTVDLILSFISDNFNPHLILYSGDTVQHTVWDQPFNQTVEVSEYITDRIATHFPGSAAYFAIGNHDTYPANLFYIPRKDIQELNAIMYTHWQPLSGFNSEQQVTFERGVYYTTDYRAGLRILSYNSIYGTLDNFYNILNVDEEPYREMQQFMEDTLAAARASDEKVILIAHHPTGGGGMIREFSQFITDLQSRYSDIIVLHLQGHSHGDSFKLVSDISTGVVGGVQISSPAMTSYTDTNPSFRIIYLDSNTYQPLDMDTYHLDINADKNNPTPEIKLVYRATTEYAMPDISVAAFEDLVNRMETDPDLLTQYRYNKETRVFVPTPCDAACTQQELCNLRYSDYERREQCYDSIP